MTNESNCILWWYSNIHYDTNMYYIYVIVSCSHPCLFIEQVIPKLQRYLFTPFDGILGSNACSRDLSATSQVSLVVPKGSKGFKSLELAGTRNLIEPAVVEDRRIMMNDVRCGWSWEFGSCRSIPSQRLGRVANGLEKPLLPQGKPMAIRMRFTRRISFWP